MVGTISVEPHSGHGRAGLLAAGRRAGNFFIADLLTQNHCILRVNRRFAENRHFLFGSGRLASQSPGNCVRFAARMTVLDATARYMANRGTGLFINGFVGLFAEFSERLLDQLDGGRGIENFLLIQVDVFDAVLAAVGGGNLLFRDIDP
jgi:hypothetical protein